MSKKLLIITYKFPPVQAPSSIRLFHFYKEASRFFDDVLVLTSKNREWMKQDASLVTDIAPSKLIAIMAYDLRYFLIGKKASKKGVTNPTNTQEGSLKKWARKLLNSFPFNLVLDDGALYYILKGYKAASLKIEKEEITHIFSSFRPYADHIIAFLLKRKYPHLIWIADFRDLHIDPVMENVLWRNHQYNWNAFLLKKASIITTVSSGLKKELARYQPPVYVLRNGLGAAQPQQQRPQALPYFSLLYTGAMFFDKRDIRPILDALVALIIEGEIEAEDCRLIYAGNDGHIWQRETAARNINKLLIDKGLLPRDEVVVLQQQVQVNILLTYASQALTGNLTSKVYEYFEAGRPILASVKGDKDPEIEDIFRQLKAGAVIYEDIDQLKTFLLAQYHKWKQNGDVGYPIDDSKLDEYRWPNMMEKLRGAVSF